MATSVLGGRGNSWRLSCIKCPGNNCLKLPGSQKAEHVSMVSQGEAREHSEPFCVFPYSLFHHLVAKANNTEEPSRNCSSSGRDCVVHQLLLLRWGVSAGDTEEDTGSIQSPANPPLLNHGPVETLLCTGWPLCTGWVPSQMDRCPPCATVSLLSPCWLSPQDPVIPPPDFSTPTPAPASPQNGPSSQGHTKHRQQNKPRSAGNQTQRRLSQAQRKRCHGEQSPSKLRLFLPYLSWIVN